MEFNEYQTPVELLGLENEPDEVQEWFWQFINTVPLIRYMVSKDRPRACDLPRDEDGKIIVDVTKPHILENVDYFRKAAICFQKNGYYTNLRPNKNPNSEFGKWIREEIRRCYEGLIRPEDGEWIPGDLYYFWNYSPMQVSKQVSEGSKESRRVFDLPSPWEGHYLKYHMLDQARKAAKHYIELASRGKGKAHPYSQVVYTPDGIKQWGDIKIGDYLFGDDGNTTKVIDIPFDEETSIYEVSLSDGRKIQCSLGHLFSVRDARKKIGPKIRVVSLEEIMNSDYYHLRKDGNYEPYFSIPTNKGVDFNERKVFIDPYTLGLAIGDGCFRTKWVNTLMFTSSDDDVTTYGKHIPYYLWKRKGKFAYSIRIPNLKKHLEYYGLEGTDSSTKFIPNDYIYNNREVRLEVLRGILDTDGTVNNNGIPMLTTVSKRLCDDVVLLCRSLGYTTRMFCKQGKYNGKTCKQTYNISILTNDAVFKLKRKLIKLTKFESSYSKSRRDWTHIVDIKFSHVEKAKCVTIDNESHCYLIGDFVTTHNSYSAASLLSKRFKIGESQDNKKGVQCFITAYEKKYLDEGGTLKKFQDDINHMTKYMPEIPHRMINDSLHDMKWTMGYKDVDTGVLRGTGNQVIGITSKDDEAKLRGTRGVLFAIEEAGNFPRLKQLWSNMLPSVEDGEKVFGLLMAFGTAGDSESDFEAMQEMMYHPDGYHIYSVENVYDKMGEGAKRFGYFFPAYINYGSFQNKDGVSDITAALLYLLKERYRVKYEASDQNALFKKISEYPITPQEATLRTKPSIFPVVDIRKRINQLDQDSSIIESNIVGDLDIQGDKVTLVTTSDIPIRSFFNQNNSMTGAIEFFELPHRDKSGNVPYNRYIAACDPIDEDSAQTSSLFSMFVMDKITGIIMCEWTGRFQTADECYERARRVCYYYNATLLIENNKIGIVAYFKRMGCMHLLAETPEWLYAKDIIKTPGYGNRALGVNTRANTIIAADERIKQWLLSPYTQVNEGKDGVNQIVTTMCYTIKSHALLEELLSYNSMGNFDRVRAFGILMLYYEEFVSKNDLKEDKEEKYDKQVDGFLYKILHKIRH